jgi:hypothetical protein
MSSKIWKETFVAIFEIMSQHSPTEEEKTTKKELPEKAVIRRDSKRTLPNERVRRHRSNTLTHKYLFCLKLV